MSSYTIADVDAMIRRVPHVNSFFVGGMSATISCAADYDYNGNTIDVSAEWRGGLLAYVTAALLTESDKYAVHGVGTLTLDIGSRREVRVHVVAYDESGFFMVTRGAVRAWFWRQWLRLKLWARRE